MNGKKMAFNDKIVSAVPKEMLCGVSEVSFTDKVKIIENDAFSRSGIETVVFEDVSDLKIGERAFLECDDLTECEILGGDIGREAFAETGLYCDIVIKEGNIGERAFCGCSGIPSLEANVRSIGDSAFRNDTSLKSADLNVDEGIGRKAFMGCDELSFVRIGGSVREIGDSSFEDCTDLSVAVLNDSLERIGDRAFGYTVLESVTLPGSLKTIGRMAFANTQLRRIVIPGNVENIGERAFFECRELKELSIGEGVKVIGPEAFSETGIFKVYIPASIESIGEGAFDPRYVREMTVAAENQYYEMKDGMLIDKRTMGLVLDVGDGDRVIPEGVVSIGPLCYGSNPRADTVRCPSTLRRIADKAFYCSDVIDVYMNEGLETIGDHAFDGSDIRHLEIPSTVKSLGKFMCYECESLWKVKIGENVSVISEGAFMDCLCLMECDIPATVKMIEGYAFSNCRMYEPKYCPGTSVEEGVFDGCLGCDD